MNIPTGASLIHKIEGGYRNTINLASMMSHHNSCPQTLVEFWIIERGRQQGIMRVDSGSEPFSKVVIPLGDNYYLTDQQENQFIPVVLATGKMALFDCRMGKNVFKGSDEITIISSFTQKDTGIIDSSYLWSPCMIRGALCRIKRNNKFRLASILTKDSRDYGLASPEFNATILVETHIGSCDSIHLSKDFDRFLITRNGNRSFQSLRHA